MLVLFGCEGLACERVAGKAEERRRFPEVTALPQRRGEWT